MNQLYKTEREYYPFVKNWLEEQLKVCFTDFHLEITANKKFSNLLKGQIGINRDIIFHFLREAPPDITGFIKGEHRSEFIIAEIKTGAIKLDDIYQVKKYADLFDVTYALLISPEEIPEEMIRLSKVVFNLFQLSHYSKRLVLVSLGKDGSSSVWFPDNPFVKKK